MLLKKKCLDYKGKISVGLGFMSLGGLSFASSVLLKRFAGPETNFFQGFFLGLAIILMGVSIFFNARGLHEGRSRVGRDG